MQNMIFEQQRHIEWINFDLSAYSELSTIINKLSVEEATKTIFQTVLSPNQVGYGGYLEKRSIYKKSQLFFDEQKNEFRCIHMGIDIWASPYTPIISPVNAIVHSFANNDNHLDYGNTIILECIDQSYSKFLLFGHLTKGSIANKQVGESIKKGEVFAHIGDVHENGGWVPHLHLQCINDLKGYIGDFPGIVLENEKGPFQLNCPDPSHYIFF